MKVFNPMLGCLQEFKIPQNKSDNEIQGFEYSRKDKRQKLG